MIKRMRITNHERYRNSWNTEELRMGDDKLKCYYSTGKIATIYNLCIPIYRYSYFLHETQAGMFILA